MRKFISPGGWFSLEYPSNWREFEDVEECFLFYNPDKWTGNFRISAYKDLSNSFGKDSIEYELTSNRNSKRVKVGLWECAYSSEDFNDNGCDYTTHVWITGKGHISFECSFTVLKGKDIKQAETIITSLIIRDEKAKLPKEIIPLRVMEIEEVNSDFDWAVTTIKKQLTIDFNSQEKDIKSIQAIIDSGKLSKQQRNVWEKMGIAFGTILINEIDGMDWITVIDGKKEYPALQFQDSSLIVEPLSIIWEKISKGELCDLKNEYDKIKEQAEIVLSKKEEK